MNFTVRLRFGPYLAPPAAPGSELTCDIYGLSIVADWTDAPVSWPRRKPGKHAGRRTLIICGDLRRALEVEAAPAVAYHWGVSEAAITRWRRALKLVGQYPDGAREVLSESLEQTRTARPEMLTQGTGPKSPRHDGWTLEQDAIALATRPKEAVEKLGRSLNAVYLRAERLRRGRR